MIDINNVRLLIANGKTKQAISVLLEFTNNQYSAYNNKVLLISNRLKKIERDLSQGIISINDHNVLNSQITKSVINICSLIEDDIRTSKGDVKNSKKSKIKLAFFIFLTLSIFATILVFLSNGSISELLGFDKAIITSNQELEHYVPVISKKEENALNFLIETSSEAKELVHSALEKNQIAFGKISSVENDIELMSLFDYQEYRSRFGEITTKITSLETQFNDREMSNRVIELNNLLKKVSGLFYYSPYIESKTDFEPIQVQRDLEFMERVKDALTKEGFNERDFYSLGSKYDVIMFLTKKREQGDITEEYCKLVSQIYLEQLRVYSQKVGSLYGYFLTVEKLR